MVLKPLWWPQIVCVFENDVEMYGAQTLQMAFSEAPTFENDVEMYGAQTSVSVSNWCLWFENDVEMYGAQTQEEGPARQKGLRMM